MTTRSRGISVNMEPKLFPTKKAAKDFVKKYLHDQFTINGRNSGIAKISGSELPWTTSLLKMHHRWDSYRDIDYIGVGPDPVAIIYAFLVVLQVEQRGRSLAFSL